MQIIVKLNKKSLKNKNKVKGYNEVTNVDKSKQDCIIILNFIHLGPDKYTSCYNNKGKKQ